MVALRTIRLKHPPEIGRGIVAKLVERAPDDDVGVRREASEPSPVVDAVTCEANEFSDRLRPTKHLEYLINGAECVPHEQSNIPTQL